MKKYLAGLAAVAVLAAGGVAMVGLTSGVAIAQEDTSTEDEQAPEDGRRHKRLGRGLGTAAETIGIDITDLVAALGDGSSVADVAAANGSSGDEVVDAILAKVSERIDAAVEAGDVTAEEGAARLAAITERVNEMVTTEIDVSELGRRGHERRRGLNTAAETIGIEVQALVDELKAGSSIADVAEANGSSGQAVIDAMVASASERIAAAVDAGRMTAEEGADKLTVVTEKITERINTVPDFDRRGHGGPDADAVDA